MSAQILGVAGGLGLFLLGMRIMTDALQAMAGGGMQRWLGRATRTPLSGAVTGMTVTAVIRSSSATTVAAVGFVGAGILSFEQALGVILGANIGTTLTGWIVAVFGFKIELGTISMGIVFVGALLSLLGRGIWSRVGLALAGFALLFIGLDLLKDGLEGAAGGLSLDRFRTDTTGGRLLLVLFGILFSISTQSSGATVATALAALSSGLLDLPQALAVVIGADVGTTTTAWLASLGGTTDSRRTALSHVVYNLLTGIMAFLLLPLYQEGIGRWFPGAEESNPQFVTVGFHSGYNILGVALVLPFTKQFAWLMRKLLPERSPSPAAQLEKRLAKTPAAAVETLHHAVTGTAALALDHAIASLARPPAPATREQLDFVARALRDCRGFVGDLVEATSETRVRVRLPEILHAIDHIDRLVDRCRDAENIRRLAASGAFEEDVRAVHDTCRALRQWLGGGEEREANLLATLETLARGMEEDRSVTRRTWIEATVRGERPAHDLDAVLDAHRWLRRVAWHVHRIAHYLALGSGDGSNPPVSLQ